MRAELDREMASAEARSAGIDTKSGLLLGFSGALLGLTAGNPGGATLLAQVAAVVSAACACAAIAPSIGKTIGPKQLLERYKAVSAAQIKQQVLINRLAQHTSDEERLKGKRHWFVWAAWSLGAATGLLLLGQVEAHAVAWRTTPAARLTAAVVGCVMDNGLYPGAPPG